MKQLFILFILFLCPFIKCFTQDLKFDKLVVEDGLTSINSIFIDDKGFTWLGGTHGLFRFDGTDFLAFNHNLLDSATLSSDNIISLFQDSRGNIWIGTENNGVNLYLSRFEKIRRINFKDQTLNQSSITAILEDTEKNIWIGTIGNGVYVIDSLYNVVNRYYHDSQKSSSLSNNTVFDLLLDKNQRLWVSTNSGKLDLFTDNGFQQFAYLDHNMTAVRTGQRLVEAHDGRIWIGTEGEGLFIFNPNDNSFTSLNAQDKSSPIKNNVITDLGKDSKGNVWISTDGGGVNLFNANSQQFSHFQFQENNEFGLSNNASYSMAIDKNDRVWLGMGDGVVNISNNTPFKFIRPSNGLSFRVVVDMILDNKGDLWAGTGGGGLNRFNLKTKEVTTFATENVGGKLNSNVILSLLEDRYGDIWAGTFLGGINKINPTLENVEWIMQGDGLSNDHVFDIVNDQHDRLWIATQGGGLNLYDPEDRSFKYFTTTNGSGIKNNRIQSLLIDSKQRLWIGFYFGGIQVLDIEKQSFINQKFISPNLSDLLRKYPIHSLYEDNDQNIWVGTGGLGLVKITHEFEYEVYDKNKGLASNSVYGSFVLNDKIWISTNKGINSIDLISGEAITLDKSDGLLTSDFESGTIVLSEDDNLFFSSKEGIVYFNPADLKNGNEEIEIIFTDLMVFNDRVEPGKLYDGAPIIESSIVSYPKINLPFSYNNFTIFFNAPSFSKLEKIQYRYKLEGLQNDWINNQLSRKFVPYSNLKEGKYAFLIQGSFDGKQWSNAKSITIEVFPPIYRSWYAYPIYIVFSLAIIFFITRIIRIRIKLTNQLKFEKYAREKDNDINKERINFFTGVSHELRTPLTLIMGPIEQLVNNINIDNRMRNQVMMMQKNANRLMILINQLLDFRKMESGKMKLQISQQDLVYFIEEILLTFRELALQKNLQLDFVNKLNSRSFYFDETKLEIIIYNLLSNAIKFTNPGRKVIVMVSTNKNSDLLIEVADNGKGISEENQDKIFDPFFRDRTVNKNEKGTGMGLYLVKNVVDLHHGKIEVESAIGSGTIFRVTIPGNAADYVPAEMMTNSENSNFTKIHKYKYNASSIDKKVSDLPTLLVVEDNEGIMEFLKESLMPSYQVYSASNGKEGLERAVEIIPDVIISDIMMPQMDGIEMCRHLKKDIRTSHVPIILLTARSGFTHELSGLDTGADDYITKPFQVELLLVRANNLIENRKKLRQKIKKDIILEPEKVAVSDPDEKFLKDLMNFIEENISNDEYSVKDLARQMGLSHSVLYRKIIALTNLTINDFIKSFRLKRGIQLLQSKAYSISEVSYLVGFSNPKYFSTCFKTEFGKSPSEFMHEITGNKS